MEIIAELEPDRRGVYSGVVGYFAYSGNTDQALALRTMIMREGRVMMQAGGGIVYDSQADYEYQETINKMAAAMKAIEIAEEIELDERARRSVATEVAR
jgi:anthranilate synthase component 1